MKQDRDPIGPLSPPEARLSFVWRCGGPLAGGEVENLW